MSYYAPVLEMMYLLNQQQADRRGYIVVTERLWNSYRQLVAPKSNGTVTFCGLALRVL